MEELLNPKSPVPLHMQLEEIIRKKIREGSWAENEKIPSENELSRQYGLSRMTVRNVLLRLSQEGILYRVQGKGTFVKTEKIVGKPLSYMGIRSQLEEKGYVSDTKLISLKPVSSDEKLAEIFGISGKSRVFELKRLRYLKQVPFSLHVSLIPEYLCPDLLNREFDFEGCQLCDILEQNYRIRQHKMIETIEIVQADEEQSRFLGVSQGYSLLHLEDVVYGTSDAAVEYSNVFFRGDRFKLQIVNTKNG